MKLTHSLPKANKKLIKRSIAGFSGAVIAIATLGTSALGMASAAQSQNYMNNGSQYNRGQNNGGEGGGMMTHNGHQYWYRNTDYYTYHNRYGTFYHLRWVYVPWLHRWVLVGYNMNHHHWENANNSMYW